MLVGASAEDDADAVATAGEEGEDASVVTSAGGNAALRLLMTETAGV